MKTNTTRRFYAMSWTYGKCASVDGKRYGATYHSFATPALRDEWCDHGGDFTTSAGWREQILSSDVELRGACVEPAYDALTCH